MTKDASTATIKRNMKDSIITNMHGLNPMEYKENIQKKIKLTR